MRRRVESALMSRWTPAPPPSGAGREPATEERKRAVRLKPALLTLMASGIVITVGAATIAEPRAADDVVTPANLVDKPPLLTKAVRPKYPKAARREGIGGVVLVEFVVDDAGRVVAPRVVQSVRGLDEAALECVRKWRLAPALKNGKAVSTVVRAPVVFTTHREAMGLPAEVVESVQVQPSPPSRPIAELQVAIGSGDPLVRAAATWEMAGVRAVSTPLLEQLRELSRKDTDRGVRHGAAWAYYRLEAGSGVTGPTRAYDEAPAPVQTPRPSPPADARARQIGGDVVVDVLISESGEVVHAEVSQSVLGLDESAVECARAWLFAPARAEGKPVPSVARVSVSFRAYK